MTKSIVEKMSAAIMHNNASIYHDCGEFLLKNQSSSIHLHQSTPNAVTNQIQSNNNNSNNLNNNNNINNSTMLTVTQLASSGVSILNANVLNNNLNLTSNQNGNVTSAASVAASAGLIQHHLNVLSVQQQQKQQQQQQQQQQHQQQQHQQEQEQKAYIHTALTRAVSHPQNGATVASLVNTLIENCHRKLERTQSEPLPQVNTSRYKTELCRPFEEAGECKYGEKCQFAHGYHELRNLQRHPKYKTEYCRTYHSVGFCPYGPRCHFVHNADEARAMIQQQQQQHQQQLQQQNRINAAFSRLPQNNMNNHPLPLSPPLSMSTGSDRASPTGSLSLSPTNSMGSFPFVDQISPASSVFPAAFSYNHSPPASPNSPMSPVNTPPPSIILGGSGAINHHQYIKPISQNHIGNKSSSPISIVTGSGGNNNTTNNNNNNAANNTSAANSTSSEEARLPVFNRLSSTLDAFSNLAL